MIIKAEDTAPPHFFMIGRRALPAGVGTEGEKVGVVITRSKIRGDGTALPAGDVLTDDEKFPAPNPDDMFRFETEVVAYKPEPDVVAVEAVAKLLPTLFGTIEIDRGAGFEAPLIRNFDWLPRRTGGRLGLAGKKDPPPADGSTLSEFDADRYPLPRNFNNAFQNGNPVAGETFFEPGDRIRFSPLAGPVRMLTIPPAPALAVTEAAAPLEPPLELEPKVDTVVLDLALDEFTLTWRVTFPWETRFETATLEVA